MSKGWIRTRVDNYIKKGDFKELETTTLSLDEWIKHKTRKCNASKKNGQPCTARAINNTDKCRYHGGESTGPKTEEGRRKSLSKLAQFRNNPEKLDEYLEKEKRQSNKTR